MAYLAEPRWELIWDPSSVSHARRLSYEHSHTRLMETHPSVTGIKHYQRSRRPYVIRTWLSSLRVFFSVENTFNLSKFSFRNIHTVYLLVFFFQGYLSDILPNILAKRSGHTDTGIGGDVDKWHGVKESTAHSLKESDRTPSSCTTI